MAQNEIEALRYSAVDFGGTARFNGMAGAFGALGADLSCANINPAGMAKFNKTEFAFTPGFNVFNSDATYNGTVGLDQGFRLNMSQVGFVATQKIEQDNFNKWKSFQFGVNYSKLRVLNQKTRISGANTNSLLAVFTQQAYGVDPVELEAQLPFTSSLAYQTYAIDPDGGSVGYTHQFQGVDTIRQEFILDRTGGMYETAISFSGNYNDKILIGGSIGIPKVKYDEATQHYEGIYYDTSNTQLEEFKYDFALNTAGTGINGKIGVIILPMPNLRLGVAVHTPTRLALTDRWSTEMTTYFFDNTSYTDVSGPGFYQYKIITPAKFIFSAAGIVAKRAAISADIEYIDYKNARLGPRGSVSDYTFENENQVVRELYTASLNMRIGAEFRVKTIFFRTGFALNGSPYNQNQESVVNSAEKKTFSIGFGYRKDAFFADMAIVHNWWKEDFYLYDPVLVNPATLANGITNVSFTVGFRY